MPNGERSDGSNQAFVAYSKMTLEEQAAAMETDPLFGRLFKEVYYLWRMTNTSLEKHLQGVHAHAEPSINRLPR